MKKVGFVMVISAFLLVGCGTKGNKAEESKAASSSETQTMTNSSSSAKQASSQTQSTTTNSQSVAKIRILRKMKQRAHQRQSAAPPKQWSLPIR